MIFFINTVTEYKKVIMGGFPPKVEPGSLSWESVLQQLAVQVLST